MVAKLPTWNIPTLFEYWRTGKRTTITLSGKEILLKQKDVEFLEEKYGTVGAAEVFLDSVIEDYEHHSAEVKKRRPRICCLLESSNKELKLKFGLSNYGLVDMLLEELHTYEKT